MKDLLIVIDMQKGFQFSNVKNLISKIKFICESFDKDKYFKLISDCTTTQNSSNENIFMNSIKRIIGENQIVESKSILKV